MSEQNSGASPVPPLDSATSAGLEIAMRWGAALGGPEQLKIAFDALEPQLKREHQIKLKQMEMLAKAAERSAREKREGRNHAFRMTGVIVGAVISTAMLGAGVYVAKDVWWLSTLLCGPSLIALVKIFVLRRSDPDDVRLLGRAARGASNAAAQAQPPSGPTQ
ncbi:hypothetical protein [Streptomyces lavendulae]|uniref:hypothetical protein n=1 Tax=Streptomyces lavendulae TaxID=1914 RepID=UPI0024A4944D|nr:hypothetical protein [Streptomyces lavendulae]GLX19673.1 hypothetical protein Slala01_33170 [Streptomyces lavendulae subsp. lavendulae]GLX27168.1 hypothetical protein Slala02_29880 [Streptomyces lavendulae subsp. lavendulae]